MSKILSQEEIDALLHSAADYAKRAPLDDRAAPDGVLLYNFRRPDRVTKEQIRSLQFLHDRFARNVATSRPHNPSGFQIISAGFDGQLGYGGVWDKSATTPLPLWGTLTVQDRDVERDNITNFSDGPLVP